MSHVVLDLSLNQNTGDLHSYVNKCCCKSQLLAETCSRVLLNVNVMKAALDYIIEGKGKVIPLQARCGPEGG